MSERLNKLYLFIGTQGTGKTTICREFANAFLNLSTQNKIIVVDTDAHPFYSDYTVVNIDELAMCKSKLIRCEDADDSILFNELNTFQRNAFIIFEDAAKYINPNVSTALKRCIIDKRKRNFDLAFMFHSFNDVPPYIARNYQAIILFKTGDNYEVNRPKFSNWHTIKEAAMKLKKDKNFNAHTVIKM